MARHSLEGFHQHPLVDQAARGLRVQTPDWPQDQLVKWTASPLLHLWPLQAGRLWSVRLSCGMWPHQVLLGSVQLIHPSCTRLRQFLLPSRSGWCGLPIRIRSVLHIRHLWHCFAFVGTGVSGADITCEAAVCRFLLSGMVWSKVASSHTASCLSGLTTVRMASIAYRSIATFGKHSKYLVLNALPWVC
jgi:hypothetical protein